MSRRRRWNEISLTLICVVLTGGLVTGCGGATADKPNATAAPPTTGTAKANDPPAVSDKVRQGWRMVDAMAAKMRATSAAVRGAKGDLAKIESLKMEFQKFAMAQRAPGKALLTSMTDTEKAQLETYAHKHGQPAILDMRQAFASARGDKSHGHGAHAHGGHGHAHGAHAHGEHGHGHKPPVTAKPGESRPPAHHSEHKEQMQAHGAKGHGAKGHGAKRHGAKRHGGKGHFKHHRFKNAAMWAKIFESKKRDKWQRGDAVVASLKLKKDARIADVGAGTGYFAIRFAKQVRSGVVYAVDIEKTMVDWVVKRARRKRLENVVGVVATNESAKLPGAVDVIFVSNTYHHISERSSYFARLQRKLRPQGRVVIVDFKMGKLPIGPPDSHKIAPDRIIAEMEKAGYKLTRRDDKLLPYQHLFVFQSK